MLKTATYPEEPWKGSSNRSHGQVSEPVQADTDAEAIEALIRSTTPAVSPWHAAALAPWERQEA